MTNQMDSAPPNAALSTQLFGAARAGHLPLSALRPALQQIGQMPSRAAWAKFLNNLLLYLGALLLVSGIFFFFAYNWADLHHFAKFGLIQAGIVAAAGLAHYLGLEKLSGKVSLTVASLLVGALLAVFGQFYQTGADSYLLFLFWAILIAGWVFIGGFQPLWLVLYALGNVTGVLYIMQAQPPQLFDDFYLIASVFFAINALFLLLWEVIRSRVMGWMQNRWFPNVVGLVTLLMISIPTIFWIFERGSGSVSLDFGTLATGLYLLFVITIFVVYSRLQRDLFMLTIAMFSLVAIATTGLVRVIDWIDLGGAAALIGIGLFIVALSGLVINLLQRISHSWNDGV